MNMHVPQSLQTENELINLAAVPTQIISPRDAKPIISIVQDIALGVYRISKDHVTINQKQYFNIMCNNSKFYGDIQKPTKDMKWSGKQILSSILPPNLNMQGGNRSYDPDKAGDYDVNYVKITNGQIKQGVIDKGIYQGMTNGLIHMVYNENGPKECTDLFDNTQKLICDWLVQDGFSVGISDLIINKETTMNMKEITHEMKKKVYNEITKIHMGERKNYTIKTRPDRILTIVCVYEY